MSVFKNFELLDSNDRPDRAWAAMGVLPAPPTVPVANSTPTLFSPAFVPLQSPVSPLLRSRRLSSAPPFAALPPAPPVGDGGSEDAGWAAQGGRGADPLAYPSAYREGLGEGLEDGDADDGDIVDLLPGVAARLDLPDIGDVTVASSATIPILDFEISQPSSDIAYFYLQNHIGLTDDEMWRVTFEAGSILGMTADNLRRKVAVLQRNMNLSDEDVRAILGRYPALLTKSADKNLSPTIILLVRALDVSKADLRIMTLRCPAILAYSPNNLLRKIEFFSEVMGYGVDGTRRLVVDEPRLMCAGVDTGLVPRLEFLRDEMEIPMEDLRAIVSANPKILMYSVERNLREKLISFLVMRLRMEPEHVRKLLVANPRFLDHSLEGTLLPTALYLLSDLEFSPVCIRSILLKYPRLHSNSLRKIKHTVGLLRYEHDLDAEQAKRVIFQAPQVFGLSEERVRSNIVFLRDAFELDAGEVRAVVSGMPTLLLCGVEPNLRPKAEHLLEAFDGDRAALRKTLLRQPSLLGYSLEGRVRPRLCRLADIGSGPGAISICISMTDAKFEEWLSGRERKIAANGGRDIEKWQRLPSARSAQLDGAGTGSTEVKDGTGEAESRGSRIVHWKR